MTERVKQFGHDRLSVFGIGRELNEKQWRAALRQLVAMGHLRARQRGVWRVEADGDRARRTEGRDRGDAARGGRRRPHPRRRAKSRRGDLAAAAGRQRRAGDPNLVAALRAWRSEMARKRGVPAYVVLHDSTHRRHRQRAPDDARRSSAASPASATRSSSITATN